MTSTLQCTWITVAGTRCSRAATTGQYCTQHYKMWVRDNESKTNTELPPELSALVSDYSEYDDIKTVGGTFNNMTLNPARSESKIIARYSDDKQRVVGTYIDGVLTSYNVYDRHGGLSGTFQVNKDKLLNGIQYVYNSRNGRVVAKYNYTSGVLNGTQYAYDGTGRPIMEYNYVNGVQSGTQIRYFPNFPGVQTVQEYTDGRNTTGSWQVVYNGKVLYNGQNPIRNGGRVLDWSYTLPVSNGSGVLMDSQLDSLPTLSREYIVGKTL